ncbi:hypothetical protein QM637_15640 [Pantoea allii]|jgi:hypothetical protein|uniref:DUF6966 domain-containing protein n=1 Tax=Pantoea allii TaxID=574096 RepID=UPI0024B71E08|nr:hypothetical protein [Pantoea allii]MDJ0037252.1 hypothetical protein [Pantoea allii]MDJ0088267.1 hypothetical protein [Pantoea allii]
MKNEIKRIIKEIIILLLDNGEVPWARYFDKCLRQLDDEYHEGIYKLRTAYGGMGSFNDLILHSNGLPLIKENELLEQFRNELYKVTR